VSGLPFQETYAQSQERSVEDLRAMVARAVGDVLSHCSEKTATTVSRF